MRRMQIREAAGHGGKPARRWRVLWAVAAGLVLVPCLGLVLGFLGFVSAVERIEPLTARKAEGVVALTGGAERIAEAVDLLARGDAGRLLITGVNQTTTGAEIARLTPQYRALFSCCIDLGYQALNTTGNATETRLWARAHRMRSLIVVTSNYHMPRALMEIGTALPGTELVPYPVVSERQRTGPMWADGTMLRILATEYVKYLVAVARTHLVAPPEPGDDLADARPL